MNNSFATNSTDFYNPYKKMLLSGYRSFLRYYKDLIDPPNTHLKATTAKKRIIRGVPIYLRPSYSDKVRMRELGKDIYSGNPGLLRKIQTEVKPTILFDFGANIGLSTLALMNKIPSIHTSVSVEGEKENFGVLDQNCKAWSKFFHRIFHAVHGVITGEETLVRQIENLGKGYSASGTFSFAPSTIDDGKDCRSSITPNQLMEKYGVQDQIIVCKTDIEGGEHSLFSSETDWLKNTVFLSIEVHDRFSSKTSRSSINLFKVILDYDFAVIPGIDTLYCYNRKILGL